MQVKRTHRRDANLLNMIWIIFTCIWAGGLIGGSTNAINGYLSPAYYRNIFEWDFPNIWAVAIAQGIFEGFIFGMLFSIVFVAVIAVVTKGQATSHFAFRYLIRIILVVYLCWIFGGLIAMGFATLSPDFYRATFIRVPDDFRQMLSYAWVGGSIWGAMFGGVMGLMLGVIGVRKSWKKEDSPLPVI